MTKFWTNPLTWFVINFDLSQQSLFKKITQRHIFLSIEHSVKILTFQGRKTMWTPRLNGCKDNLVFNLPWVQ